ncbi:MAG TPA: hypothetical protein VG368_07340, partial [Acidimicrobiales bacterium]|nr:hypothetical protein [Acidimicrobiales bacterium]
QTAALLRFLHCESLRIKVRSHRVLSLQADSRRRVGRRHRLRYVGVSTVETDAAHLLWCRFTCV